MSTELKPCPHCGGEAEFYDAEYGYDGIHNAVMCSRCSACCENVDEWNTRADGWISVDDARPDNVAGNKIWCFYDGTQFESEFDDGLWCNVFGDPFTHWMPLPSPPRTK